MRERAQPTSNRIYAMRRATRGILHHLKQLSVAKYVAAQTVTSVSLQTETSVKATMD
jgi:hypothetical protein